MTTDPLLPDPALAPELAAAAFHVVTLALAVVGNPYRFHVTTAPSNGVVSPPGLSDNGSVPFIGIVCASKNWFWILELYVGPGKRVKLYRSALRLVELGIEEQVGERRVP